MKTTLIADIGTNWHSLDDILRSIDALRAHGVLAKLQAWITEEFVRKGHLQWDAYKRWEIPESWYKKLRAPDVFFTPFDLKSVDRVERICAPQYWKIASPDCVYRPLVKKVAELEKPTFMSVGGATDTEVCDAIGWFSGWSRLNKLTLLDSVCNYPCKNAELGHFRNRSFSNSRWGYSSHSRSTLVPALVVALGAVAVEVHFRLDAITDTPDAGHSFTQVKLKKVVSLIEEAEANCGDSKRPCAEEVVNLRRARRGKDGKRC